MLNFIQTLPKAELHIHIEGSLEAQMMMDLAIRNNSLLPYASVADIEREYDFADLEAFLDLYYQGMNVLQTEQDFYDLMFAYLQRAHLENVKRAEIFFDPQGHTSRGIAWSTFMYGFKRALDDAQRSLGIEGKLILNFLRHLPEADAITTFAAAMEFRELFIGVGLDSTEFGFPPRLFKTVFRQAKDAGLYLVAHAGESGPAEYVWEAIDILGVDRIDHGNHAIDDPALVKRLAQDKIALTMCPLSTWRVKSLLDMKQHPLRKFMEAGVIVTINSDDPAYFGGYINANYQAIAEALQLSQDELSLLAKNSLDATFPVYTSIITS